MKEWQRKLQSYLWKSLPPPVWNEFMAWRAILSTASRIQCGCARGSSGLEYWHEETAAFAAGAEAALTGKLAVCAGSCGPGNLHLINGLYRWKVKLG